MDPALLDVTAAFDCWVVWLDDEPFSRHPTWAEACAAYRVLRAHAAMARESLTHTLSKQEARK